jgi:hypothetical protein
MNLRGLLVAAIVLLVFIGLYYWSNHASSAKTTEAAVKAPPKILALNQADIIKLEIKKKDNQDVVVARESSGDWRITSPKEFAADSSAVSGMLSTVSALSAERVVDEKAADLQNYGLQPPAAEIVITENGNQSQQLLLGDNTPSGGAAYAALAGSPRVFTVAIFIKTSLDKGLNDLRDKRFLTVADDKVNRLELLTGKSEIEFDRDKDQWQIVKPKPSRADSGAVDDLLRKLTNAKIDLKSAEDDQAKTAASFSKAESVGTAKVTSVAGSQELNVRKIGNDYYAKSSAVDDPYKIPSDIGQEFSKNLDDFRNKKLFDFGYTDPARIEFRDGQKSYFLTKGGEDWWGSDGKKMEPATAYSFLDKLREFKADKFVESGFGSPAIEITVTPVAGGQVEKVLLSKNGADYIAKKENDPSLYQLDAKAVEDLEHAAGEMKPAATKK